MGQEEIYIMRNMPQNAQHHNNANFLCLEQFGTWICDRALQAHILKQVNTYVNRNNLYFRLEELLFKSMSWMNGKPVSAGDDDWGLNDGEIVSDTMRNEAASHLRFLTWFYQCKHNVFALSLYLLDELLRIVRVHFKALPMINTACFYIALHACGNADLVPVEDLLRTTQYDQVTVENLYKTSALVLEKVQLYKVEFLSNVIFPLHYLEIFFEIVCLYETNICSCGSPLIQYLISRLHLMLCNHSFLKYNPEMLALCVLHFFLLKSGLVNPQMLFNIIFELLSFCQMDAQLYDECLTTMRSYLNQYETEPIRRPRCKLLWVVSRRLLSKMRPSTKLQHHLETILEDDDHVDFHYTAPTCLADNHYLDTFLAHDETGNLSIAKGDEINDSEQDSPISTSVDGIVSDFASLSIHENTVKFPGSCDTDWGSFEISTYEAPHVSIKKKSWRKRYLRYKNSTIDPSYGTIQLHDDNNNIMSSVH